MDFARRVEKMAGGRDPPWFQHERPSLCQYTREVWPDIARDYILLGINGETPSSLGTEPQFNYTYVNYMGHSTYKGFPGTDRESPALVSEAMAELKGVYPISHYFVGGHSQGGFLTYSLLMNFPETMAGAFPISSL